MEIPDEIIIAHVLVHLTLDELLLIRKLGSRYLMLVRRYMRSQTSPWDLLFNPTDRKKQIILRAPAGMTSGIIFQCYDNKLMESIKQNEGWVSCTSWVTGSGIRPFVEYSTAIRIMQIGDRIRIRHAYCYYPELFISIDDPSPCDSISRFIGRGR